jgi:peptide/nickel transport system substrate-binding protein
MTDAAELSSNGATPANQTDDNVEWQLSELVDAIAAEIDRAQDTLSLKSYARGLAFAIKTLSLDIEVKARRSTDGRLLFRTVDKGESSATVLKLGFAQVLQSQLNGVRKPLADDLAAAGIGVASLATLDEIASAEESAALHAVGIHALDDLVRYTQTPQLMAELSRKTRIPEARLRQWQQLPFMTEARPASGPPGSTVVIEGGNFGNQPGFVFFQQKEIKILDWRESRLTVEIPVDCAGPGLLVAHVGDQITNPLPWETASVDLTVRDMMIIPAQPAEGDEIVVTAELVNQGNLDADAFAVQWQIDGQSAESLAHGPLLAQQRSQESSIRRKLKLSAGAHRITFTADPAGKLPDVNRQNGTFSKQVLVRTRQKLTVGDFRTIGSLDPLGNEQWGPADVLRLIFGGLGRLDPETGTLTPDLAEAWDLRTTNGGVTRFVVRLRDGVYFHNGAPLTLDDVKFTYETLLNKVDSPWYELAKGTISEVRILNRNERTLAFGLKVDSEGLSPLALPPQLLTVGLLPQKAYTADPAQFGRRPVGSGPFQLSEFIPGQAIHLAAFRQYVQGKPRLDQIEIRSEPAAERLIQMLADQTVTAAVFPYTQALAEQLVASGQADWQPIPAPPAAPTLLHVGTSKVHERFPNAFDTGWNAHLWYV